jgi:hypothetical protein
MLKFVVSVTAGLVLTAVAALAQPAPAPSGGGMKGEVMQACQADMEKFCASTPAGHGAKIQCLKSHAKELSPDCKAAIVKKHAEKQQQQSQPQ